MKKDKWRSWPELLLLIACAIWLLYGISQKEGYHMDELLSFELANAKFNPWIVPTQPQGRLAKFVEQEIEGETFGETLGNLKDTISDVLQNKGNSKLLTYKADVYEEPVWITAEQFGDYITVGDRDAFDYLSVYFNVKDDNHPPLHFMALHTVSSVFRGQITPLMGCGINLICVLGIMGLLMWMGRMLCFLFGKTERGRFAGFWAAALYGFSAGAMSTTLLIRMYGMLSFWCAALLAIHLSKLAAPRLRVQGEQGYDFCKKNRWLILVTLCGFWTQYFFLFYCLILAAVTVILLWRADRKQEVWCYIRSMVSAAVIGLVCFPFAISDVFSSGRGVEALANLSSGLDGYGMRLRRFGGILVQETGVLTVLLVGAVMIGCIAWHLWKERGIVSRGLVGLLLLPAIGYFLLAARMSPYLVDRYIMPLFPLVILLSVVAVSCFAGKRLLWGMAALTILLQPVQTWRYDNPYLYRGYEAQVRISEEYGECPCICIGDGVGYYENLPEFTHYRCTLILTPQEFEKTPDSIQGMTRVVVLLKDGADREKVCEIMAQSYDLTAMEVLMPQGGAHGDEILYFGTVSRL